METNFLKKLIVLMVIVTFSNFMAISQITYLSGTGTNNCGTTAGTSGVNSTFIGCGAGNGAGGGGGARNSFIGSQAGFNTTAWDANVAVGFRALYTLAGGASHDSTYNVAVGNYALYTINPTTNPATNGIKNSAFGHKALYSNTTANNNTAVGFHALASAAGAADSNNVAVGYRALANTNGTTNGGLTAVGAEALLTITNGSTQSTAVGFHALRASTGKGPNTAVGSNALNDNDGNNNTAVGSDASLFNPNGNYNSIVGYAAGKGVSTNSYSHNSFFGYESGMAITTGGYNTFAGSLSGTSNTTGYDNVFTGYQSGNANTTGRDNVFSGYRAGYSNTTGYTNTFVGTQAGYSNTTTRGNAFFGQSSGYSNTASYNTFTGAFSGYSNTSGANNTFSGYYAGQANTTAGYNTYFGSQSGYANTTGYGNTAMGYNSGDSYANDTLCTFVGYGADANGNYKNATAIGNGAITTATNMIYMGNVNNLLYCQAGVWSGSDGRFKFNINENVKGLDFINKLRPVTYQMNTRQLDDFTIQNMSDSVKTMHHEGMDFATSTAIVHSGFIAQEVDSVANACGFISDIVHTPANNTDHYALNYAEFVVPLVKAVQELSNKYDSLLAIIGSIGTTKSLRNTDNSQGQNSKEVTLQIQLANNVVLYQNEPNPFDGNTVIRYFIPENLTKDAYILFFDSYGKEIKKVGIKEKGFGKINADTQNLTGGVYSYSLMIDGVVKDTKKMVKE